MIRYGAAAGAMRPMVAEDLLISRLRLLIIMTKAYLKGYPLGDFRKTAVTRNSRHVFYKALHCTGSSKATMACSQSPASHGASPAHHLFLQRAQLQAVMLNATVKGMAGGNYRNRAMAENIDRIGKYMADRVQIGDAAFLKVA